MQNEKLKIREHKLEVLSREILKVNAVRKIEYLSPSAVLIATDVGKIAVRGERLYVDNLDSKTGELLLKGFVNSVSYLDKDADNKWTKRIFR